MKRDDIGFDGAEPIGSRAAWVSELPLRTPPAAALQPPAAPVTQTYHWDLPHARIVIEVDADGNVRVNGERVDPHRP